MNNNKVLPQLGSISDVANIFKYDKGNIVPVDTSEYYPASQKYENITIEDIISKRRKAFLKRAYQLEAFNETGEKYRLTKIEVNGKLQEYTIEAPKSGVSIGDLLNPIRLPTECEPEQKSFKVLIPTLKKNSAELYKEIVFPNSNKPSESSPLNVNTTTDNINGNINTEIKPIKKLLFESNFECGNLDHVDFVTTTLNATEGEYDIYLRKDPAQIREEFWFFFRVKNMTKNKKYRINFCDYNSRIMRSHTAARPLMISIKNYLVNGKGWERCGTDIDLKYQAVDDNNRSRSPTQNNLTMNDDLDYNQLPKKTKSYIWSMTVTFTQDDDTVYLAYSQPYSYSHHQMTIYTLLHDDFSGNHLKVKELCRTAAGNRVELLTITELGDEQLPRHTHKKRNKSGDLRKKGKGNKNTELSKDLLEGEHTHKIDNRRDKDKDLDFDLHNIRRQSSNEGILDIHNITGERHSRLSPCTSTAPQTQCVSPESPGELTPPQRSPSNSPAPAPSFLQKMQNSILKGEDPSERFQKKLTKSILKKVVVILSRAHPGDTNSAWACDGLIRFLVGPKKQAKALRKRLVFVILPMPSPDGVVSGCSLADPQGGDMATCWGDMKADQHPALFEFRKLVRALGGAGRIEAFLELKGGIFSHAVSFFGCSREGVSTDRPGSSNNGMKPVETVGMPPLAPIEEGVPPLWKSIGNMKSTDGHDSATESIIAKSTSMDNYGGNNISKSNPTDFSKIQFSSSKDRNTDDRLMTLSRAAERTTTTATPGTGTGTDREEEGKPLSDKLGENDPNELCKEPFRLALAAANRTKLVSLHRCRFVDIGTTHAGGYHDFNYSEENKSKKNATEGFAYYAACRFLGARISFCVRIGLLGERGKHVGALLGSDNFIRFGRTLARSICDILVPEYKIEDAPRKERKRQNMIDRIFTSNALQNKIEEAAVFLAQMSAKQNNEETKKDADGNKEVIGTDTGSVALSAATNTEGIQDESNSTVVTEAKEATAVTTKSKVEHLSSEDTSGTDEEDYIVLRTTASNTAITSISHYAEKINLKAMEELWEQPWDGRSSSSESNPDSNSDSSSDSRKTYRKGLSRKASSRRNQSIRRLISFNANNPHKSSKPKEKVSNERSASKPPTKKRKSSRRASSQTRHPTYNHTLESVASSISSTTSRPSSINLSITASGTGPTKSLRNRRNNTNIRQNVILENDVNNVSADNSPRDFSGQPGEVMMVAGAVLGNKILHSYPDQSISQIQVTRAPSQGNSRHALKKGKHLTMMQRHIAALGQSQSPGLAIEIVSKNNSAQNSPKTPFVTGSHFQSDMYPPSDSDNSEHFFFNKTVAMPGKSFSKRYNKNLASSGGTSVSSTVDKKKGGVGYLPKDVEADLNVISRITHSGGASSGRSSSRPSSGRPTSTRPVRLRYRDKSNDKDKDDDNDNVEEEEVIDEEQKVRLFITEMMEQRNSDVINRLRGDPNRKGHYPIITQSSEDLADSRCTSPFDYLCPEGVTRATLLRTYRSAVENKNGSGDEDDEFDDEGVDWREEIDLKSPIFFVTGDEAKKLELDKRSPVLRGAAGSRGSTSPRGERRASYLRKIVNLIPEEMVPHAAQLSTSELPPGSVIIAPVPATIGSPDRELSSPLGVQLPLIDKPSYTNYTAAAVPILPLPSRYSSFDSTIETLPSTTRKSIISLNGEPDHLVLDENGEYSKAYEFNRDNQGSNSSSDSDDNSTTSDISNNSSESEAMNIYTKRRRSRKRNHGSSLTPYSIENTMLPLINHGNSHDSGSGGPFISSSPRANQLFGQKTNTSHSNKPAKPYTTRKSMISSLDLSDFNHLVASIDNPIEEGNEEDEDDHNEDNMINGETAKWHEKIIHQKHPLRFTVEISDGRSDSSTGKKSPTDKIRLEESSSLRDMSGHRFPDPNPLLGGSPRHRIVRFTSATGNTKHYMEDIVHYTPTQKDIPLPSSYSNRVALPVASTALKFESPRLSDAEDRRLKISPQRARNSPSRGRLSPLSPGRQSSAGFSEVNLLPTSSPDNDRPHTPHEGEEKMLKILNLFRLPEKKSKGALASEEKLALETEQTVLRISESCRSIPHTTDKRGCRPVHVKSLLDVPVNSAAIVPNKTTPPSKTISSASLTGALDISDIIADNSTNGENVLDINQHPIAKRESFAVSETNSTTSSYFFKNILANALGMKPTVISQRDLNTFDSNIEDNPNTEKNHPLKICREKSDGKIIDDENEIRKTNVSSKNKKRVYERRASIQKLRKKLDGELEAAIKRGEDIIKESQNYKERK